MSQLEDRKNAKSTLRILVKKKKFVVVGVYEMQFKEVSKPQLIIIKDKDPAIIHNSKKSMG